jgi:hypothetical protein
MDILGSMTTADWISLGIGTIGAVLGLLGLLVNWRTARAGERVARTADEGLDLAHKGYELAREAKEDAKKVGESQIAANLLAVSSQTAKLEIYDVFYTSRKHTNEYCADDHDKYRSRYQDVTDLKYQEFRRAQIEKCSRTTSMKITLKVSNDGAYPAEDVGVSARVHGPGEGSSDPTTHTVRPGYYEDFEVAFKEDDFREDSNSLVLFDIMVGYRDGMGTQRRMFLASFEASIGERRKAVTVEVQPYDP